MKKIKKLIITLMASLTLLYGVSAVFPDAAGMETVEAAAVRLSKTTLTLSTGQKYRLSVTGTTQKVKWKSSKPKVASVGSKGLVTGQAAGVARITATVGTQKYTCIVSVKTSVFSVSSTSASVNVNKTASVTLTSKNNGSVTYHIGNTSIISCKWADHWDGNTIKLFITGKKAGSTKIRITNKNNNKVLVISVKVTQAAKSGKTILKEYIVQHGNVNSDGDRFISRKATHSGDSYNFGIVYKASTDTFSFVTTTTGTNDKSAIEMNIPNKTISSVSLKYNTVSLTKKAGFSASATIQVPTYSSSTTTKFAISKKVGLSSLKDETASQIVDSYFKLCMTQWNALLKNKAGITMKDLGFTAYS